MFDCEKLNFATFILRFNRVKVFAKVLIRFSKIDYFFRDYFSGIAGLFSIENQQDIKNTF